MRREVCGESRGARREVCDATRPITYARSPHSRHDTLRSERGMYMFRYPRLHGSVTRAHGHDQKGRKVYAAQRASGGAGDKVAAECRELV